MKSKQGFIYLLISTGLFLGACKAGKEASASEQDIPVISTKPMIKGGEEVKALPNATIFKMNGDYANNVALTLDKEGRIVYYPDPSDISSNSFPIPLGKGWFLNRQGLGPDSRFTSYTYETYRQLQSPPTHEQLLESIIPGATVTEFVELPIPASQALANPQICIQYLPD